MSKNATANFAIFVSGYGNGAIELIKENELGLVEPRLSLLLSTNPESTALSVAKEHGIPVEVVNRSRFDNQKSFEQTILRKLLYYGVDYIFLAGYRLIIGKTLLDEFTDRIVNIHPSLLPAFKGLNAIGQALEAGVKVTGITTHIVNERLDDGKILNQKEVPVDERDSFNSLSDKIFKAGTAITLETVNNYFVTKRVEAEEYLKEDGIRG